MTKKVKKENTNIPATNKKINKSMKTKPGLVTNGKSWNQLQISLNKQIIQSLKACQFTTMFPVQEASIPLLLKNYDLAVEAQTGSGKTLSFLVPLLQKYLALSEIENFQGKNNQQEEGKSKIYIRYLLISPTRELCQQTYSVLLKLLRALPDQKKVSNYEKYCHCVTGGNDLQEDISKVRGKTIVLMGTVGRIRQIGQSFEANWLKKVDYLFIDEADRVLKQKGIQDLIKNIQKLRRTAMFSATLQGLQPKDYQFFGMRNLAKISLKAIGEKKEYQQKAYIIPKSLYNTYIVLENRVAKLTFLINFFQTNFKNSKTIVFFNTCASVDYYTKLFQAYFPSFTHSIYGIHGRLKTKKRSRIITEFLEKQNGILLATDVVSRGIDFDFVHFIIQIDPPEDPDNYVHRIGRTARVNRPGTAILLIQSHQEAFITYLAQKSVGVMAVLKDTFTNSKSTPEAIQERMLDIIVSDRDFIEKAKKAFVSYIRSYKEHDLKYIFQFKNLDIGSTAQSFFLLRIPRIKEILGKTITNFTQSSINIEQIRWKDKNQEKQYLAKKELRQNEKQENIKVIKQDIHNKKSKRKRVKEKNKAKQMALLNAQHRKILKDKKGSKEKIDRSEQSQHQDTEEIQRRLGVYENT